VELGIGKRCRRELAGSSLGGSCPSLVRRLDAVVLQDQLRFGLGKPAVFALGSKSMQSLSMQVAFFSPSIAPEDSPQMLLHGIERHEAAVLGTHQSEAARQVSCILAFTTTNTREPLSRIAHTQNERGPKVGLVRQVEARA
jgi:hypothetical protein